MLKRFERLWAVEVKSQNPNVIVALDYAHTQSRHISRMTVAGLVKATEPLARYPNAILLYGNSSHSHPGSEKSGSEKKRKLFEEWGVRPHRILDVGGLQNSVEEAELVRDALAKRGIYPKEILVITGKIHSRSALLIWRKVFPGVRISLQWFAGDEVQQGHQFWSQQKKWRWALIAIPRHLVVKIPFIGLSLARKVKHRGAK